MAQESVLRIVIDSRNAERNAQNIARELQSIERNGDHASRSMDSMSVATRSLVGYMSGLVTIGAAINKMDTYTGLTNKLKLVTVNQTELNKAMGDTFKIAQNTAQAWDSVAQIYQRFSDNAKRLNITQAETASLTETVAKAISISGGSAASAEAALIQFSQALASNVLRGEELNSVMEQAPGLAKAIAQGMGITVGQLRSVAAEGKITGDVLVEALGKAKASVDDLFSKTDFTIAQSFTQLSNEVTKFVGEAGKSSGAANALSGSIKVLAENLELIANGAFVIGIGYATKAIAAKTVAIYSSIVATTASIEAEKVSAAQTLRSALAEKTAAEAELTRARDAVVSAEMQVQADRKVIASEMQRIESSLAQVAAEKQLEIQRLKSQINDQGRIATSTRMAELQQVQASMTAELTVLERQLGATTVASSAQFVAAREAQVVATGNLAATTEVATLAQAQNNAVQRAGLLTSTGLVGALGGPLGLGITVAALAATYLMFKDSSDDVNDSLSSQIEVVSDLAQKYRELTLAKLISEQDALEKKLKNSESQSSKAIASLMGVATATEHSTDKQKKQSEEMNRIATSLRGGAITTGKALIQMRESGFTEAQIKKASAFFDEFDKGKAGANEAGRQIDYVSQQTGIYGDKLDASTKKIADQKAIVNALSGDYKNFSDEMSKNIDWLLQQDGALNATVEQQKKVTDAVDAWKKGTIDATDVAKIFKSNLPIDSSLLTGLGDLATKTDNAKKELNTANGELKQVQANGPKAKQGFSDAAQGAKDAKGEVDKLNEKLKDFNKTLYDRDFDANFKKMALERTKFSEKQIQAVMEVTQELRKKGVALDSDAAKQLYAETLRITKIEEQGNKILDDRNEAEKKITKEKEKQLKLGQRLIGISGNSGIGTGAHLDVRYGGSRDGQKVSKEHLARLQAGGKSLASYKVSSDYGQRKAPTKGASSFHKGIDFDMPVNTPITTNVAVKDVKTAYDSKGGGYYSTVTFEDGVVLKLLHQAPSAMSKIKGGSSDGTLKANQDIEKQAEQQANTQLQLQMAVATERKRIETQLQEDIKEINKAGFSPEETKRLISEYQARADNDIAIAQYALKTKLNDYESFRKSEETLLKESFDQKKFYAARDLELSKEDRKKAVALLESQYQQELALVKLAKEQRIFQAEQAMMTEIQVMQERYRFERDEIIKTTATDLDERRRRLNALNTDVIRGGVGKNFSDPNDTGSQFLQSVQYSPVAKSNIERLDEENAAVLQKLKDRLDAVKEAENTSYEERLEAERIFKESKEQLDDEYYFKAQDARRMDYENQLSMYNSMISMTGGVFGELMGIVSQYKEENTKTYKTMFAFQKTAALAQAIVSTELAAIQVMADPTALTMSQKLLYAGIIRATGYMSAGIIAGQALAGPGGEGYANGGYTGHGGKYEPAGIVHKGEGVLTKEEVEALGGPQGFEDLRKSIRRGYSTGGLVADTHRVGMGAMNAINNGGAIQAEKQAQANAKVQSQNPQVIDNNLRVIMVKDENEAKDWLYSPEGERAFLYHMKRNRSKV